MNWHPAAVGAPKGRYLNHGKGKDPDTTELDIKATEKETLISRQNSRKSRQGSSATDASIHGQEVRQGRFFRYPEGSSGGALSVWASSFIRCGPRAPEVVFLRSCERKSGTCAARGRSRLIWTEGGNHGEGHGFSRASGRRLR